jgi:hypothetical protein
MSVCPKRSSAYARGVVWGRAVEGIDEMSGGRRYRRSKSALWRMLILGDGGNECEWGGLSQSGVGGVGGDGNNLGKEGGREKGERPGETKREGGRREGEGREGAKVGEEQGPGRERGRGRGRVRDRVRGREREGEGEGEGEGEDCVGGVRLRLVFGTSSDFNY